MNKNIPLAPRKAAAAVFAVLALAGVHDMARADERADLEQLRATTMGLIEALVEGGVISRDKAEKMLKDAESKARMAARPPAVAAAPPVETGKGGKRVVRVPYVPEAMKQEMRGQLKQEVLAQARQERWGNPDILPSWLGRFTFEGDIRLRTETAMLDRNNTPAGALNTASGLSRGADLVPSIAGVTPAVNTTEDFTRMRLRARLGASVRVSDSVSAGVRLSTGNTTGPTSTNQTVGQGFNRYNIVLDRGYVALEPVEGLRLSGGRIANPFHGTDLVWADDLGFEGVAATYSRRIAEGWNGFATAGWFPLRADSPLQTSGRHLAAVQLGVNWKSASGTEFRLSSGLYQYHGISGRQETTARFNAGNPAGDYGTREEYPSSMRQRGNTLFLVNAVGDGTQPNFFGLASEFRTLNITGNLDIATFDPVRIVLTADYVKNLGFDRQSVFQRTGLRLADGKDSGYLARILVGQPVMRNQGDWNASVTYRWLGSDAVLDAFTSSDFGLGGTNNKGFVIGANYGIATNSWVSMRWMSSTLIDSMAPRVAGATAASTKLATDLLQVDFNARF